MTITERKTFVITSGYYNPLHVGHVRYLNQARELGDVHIAIINNDAQVRLKGNVPFMSEQERLEILSALKAVDIAVLSLDTDRTVCSTIMKVVGEFSQEGVKWVFAKGGDRVERNIPEKKICRDLGIELAFNIGGDKIQSSSALIRKAQGNEFFIGVRRGGPPTRRSPRYLRDQR